MADFRIRVIETRMVEVEYVVEAATLSEAEDKAREGVTEIETDLRVVGVADRALA